MSKVLNKMPVPDPGIDDEDYEALEAAEKTLTEGTEYTRERARLAWIAFETAWGVVQNLEKDPLADTEEEEKALKKAKKLYAESQAEKKKVADAKSAANKTRQQGNNRRTGFANGPTPSGVSTQSVANNYGARSTNPRSCFKCGSPGHIASDCRMPAGR